MGGLTSSGAASGGGGQRSEIRGRRSEDRDRVDIAGGGERKQRSEVTGQKSEWLDIARVEERQERPMNFLKRRLRSLALAGQKCSPDAGLRSPLVHSKCAQFSGLLQGSRIVDRDGPPP
jgi:hypothetical protein